MALFIHVLHICKHLRVYKFDFAAAYCSQPHLDLPTYLTTAYDQMSLRWELRVFMCGK